MVRILRDTLVFHVLTIGHFDIYQGDFYERTVEEHLNVMQKVIRDKNK